MKRLGWHQIEGAPPGDGGSTFVGTVTHAVPNGVTFVGTGLASSGQARMMTVTIPGPMRLRALTLGIQTAGAGAITWGLFDPSTDPTAATKIAGGSSAPGATGFRELAATGGPINVDPGNYILIVQNPSSGTSTIRNTDIAQAAPGLWRVNTSYTWSDTPNVSSAAAGWSTATATFMAHLVGDLNATGTAF